MFKDILVGVDLGQCRPLEIAALNPLARDTIQRSIWLAQSCSANLRFFSVFNVSEATLHGLDSGDRSHVMLTLEEKAIRVLDELVEQAADHHVRASRGFALGKPWLEIIREVLKRNHDLAIVGTRDLSGFRRMLFGNTAVKLVRRCPCPVWVAKPGMTVSSLNILVATNLQSSSAGTLGLGVSLAKVLGATLHILHAVEYPLDRLAWIDLATETTDRYHAQVRGEAQSILQEQLEQAGIQDLQGRYHIHLEDGIGAPDITIQQFIHAHRIDLLIMGTVGRGGLTGVLIGNTAERLLPEIHCSLLAVKPPDFQCPVTLEE